MLFNSFIFLGVFLPVTYVVFWCLRTSSARYIWLTLTGYIFYGYWDPRFTLLMAFSTLVSYYAGLGFLRWSDPCHRGLCLLIPVTADLALLAFFKYTNFLVDSARSVVQAFGVDVQVPHLNIILPVGISFYTFHTISYIVDAYRGVIRPTRNFFEFSAYVSLFSQLVAGPIVRFRQIEEDLERIGDAARKQWVWKGLSFFVIGLIEKVVVADALAAFVDPALESYAQLSTVEAWLIVTAYSFQLYFDFAGYSDMAVGLGYLFGLRIPQNFNSPYKAINPSDFWQRWHISLSSCLRDYIYIPFGGNRHGEMKTYRNLMLTMLIGGLWHGASWTFVVWGAYHGLLLCLYRRVAASWDALPRVVSQPMMFILALFGWVFFRSTSFTMAWAIFVKMFTPVGGLQLEGTSRLVGLLLIAGLWAMRGPNAFDWHAEWHFRPRYAIATAAAFGVCVAVMAGKGSSPFLYFQF